MRFHFVYICGGVIFAPRPTIYGRYRMAQVVRSPKEYDVCIIGSGAGGGTAAKVLTEGGLNVVMLEAGPTSESCQRLQRACVALCTTPSRGRRRWPGAS